MRRATRSDPAPWAQKVFLSTLSLRRATADPGSRQSFSANFYPRSPCGERLACFFSLRGFVYFYPRSPCGERPIDLLDQYQERAISIHALLAESDHAQRRAPPQQPDFYPRSPCGERLEQSSSYNAYLAISIHALLAESDQPTPTRNDKNNVFLSTLSLRRATRCKLRRNNRKIISIHALLAESDPRRLTTAAKTTYFYPRSPCGERPYFHRSLLFVSNFYPRSPCGERLVVSAYPTLVCRFLSTLSLRRATQVFQRIAKPFRISIHALLAESDH